MNNLQLLDVYLGSVVRLEAPDFLYALMKERDPEINISHSALPSWEDHLAFIHSRPFRCWYLIESMNEGLQRMSWVGYVSATERNEIGVVLKRSARGMGIGPAAIRMLMGLHEPLPAEPGKRSGHWLANIAPANEHSKHVFQQLGFRKIQETFEFPSSRGGEPT